jgi:hypothetical protein
VLVVLGLVVLVLVGLGLVVLVVLVVLVGMELMALLELAVMLALAQRAVAVASSLAKRCVYAFCSPHVYLYVHGLGFECWC